MVEILLKIKKKVNFNCVKTHLICSYTILVVENIVQKFGKKFVKNNFW